MRAMLRPCASLPSGDAARRAAVPGPSSGAGPAMAMSLWSDRWYTPGPVGWPDSAARCQPVPTGQYVRRVDVADTTHQPQECLQSTAARSGAGLRPGGMITGLRPCGAPLTHPDARLSWTLLATSDGRPSFPQRRLSRTTTPSTSSGTSTRHLSPTRIGRMVRIPSTAGLDAFDVEPVPQQGRWFARLLSWGSPVWTDR